jgi:hypothetical protein
MAACKPWSKADSKPRTRRSFDAAHLAAAAGDQLDAVAQLHDHHVGRHPLNCSYSRV